MRNSFILAALAGAVAVSGCTAAPTVSAVRPAAPSYTLAQATPNTQVFTFSEEGFELPNPCTGETCIEHGALQFVTTSNFDAAGNFHIGFHINSQNHYVTCGDQRGEDITTHEEQSVFTAKGVTSFSVSTMRNIIFPGPGNDFKEKQTFVFTFDANGQIHVQSFAVEAFCAGG